MQNEILNPFIYEYNNNNNNNKYQATPFATRNDNINGKMDYTGFKKNNFYNYNPTDNTNHNLSDNYFLSENFDTQSSYSFHNQGFAYLNSQFHFNKPRQTDNSYDNPLSSVFKWSSQSPTPYSHTSALLYETSPSYKRCISVDKKETKKMKTVPTNYFLTRNISYSDQIFSNPPSDQSFMKTKELFSEFPLASKDSLTSTHEMVPSYSTGSCLLVKADSTMREKTTFKKHLYHIEKPKRKKRVINKVQRQAANLRERKRMNRLNEAFEELWKMMPEYAFGHFSSQLSSHIKLSRVFILKSALSYIEHLDGQLNN